MALVVGSVVALVNGPVHTPQYNEYVQRQPPQFGLVSDVSGAPAITVLWPDGHLQAAIPNTVLDEIIDPDAGEAARVAGRVVRHTPPSSANSDSANYDGIVVNTYKRALSGGATVSGTIALVRSQDGTYFEFQTAELTVITGQ